MTTDSLVTITVEEKNPAVLYLLTLTTKVSRSTQRYALNDFAAFAAGQSLGSFPWSDVRPEHLLLYRDALLLRLKPKTVNRYLSALRGVAKQAWTLGQIDGETLERIRAVPAISTETLVGGRDLEDEVLRAIVAMTDRYKSKFLRTRDRAILTLLYASGMRRAELCGLDVADVVFADHLFLRAKGKGHKEREIPVSLRFADALKAWLDVRGRQAGPLFTHRDSTRRLRPPMIGEIVRRLARSANVGRVTPHDFRRTYAGRLLDHGADLPAVARLMGHANVATTSRYDRRGKRAIVAAADKLPRFG